MVNGLYIGKNALLANQAALTVVSNNIANMNTEGYSKQRVNFESLSTNELTSSYMQKANQGYGVDISSIQRYRNSYLDSYYRTTNANENYYQTMAENASSIESFANEFQDSGISKYLTSFFDAAQSLSLNPTDATMQTNFVQNATNFAYCLNSYASQLSELRTNLVGDIDYPATMENSQIAYKVDTVNSLLTKIADLNQQAIYQTSSTTSASAGLLDQRDLLLDELSQYMKIDVTENVNGSISINLGKYSLVSGTTVSNQLKTNLGDENNPTIISLTTTDGRETVSDIKDLLGTSGQLAAILTLGGDSTDELSIKGLLNQVDLLASEFAQQVNDIQLKRDAGPPAMTSACLDRSTGELKTATRAIFQTSDGTGTITAANIKVNQAVLDNPSEVATAYVEATDTTSWGVLEPDEVGNNASAQAFAELQTTKITALGSLTFNDYNTLYTSKLGSKISSISTDLDTQDSILEGAASQRSSETGVNVEEELMDLVKYQRAYEASARIMTVSSEVLETLVNLAR